MKKFFAIIFSILLVAVGYSQYSSEKVVWADGISQQITAKFNSGKDLSVEDVKFDYDKKVFSGVKSAIVEASPLEYKDDKPDYVKSRNVHFSISYANSKKSPAEIAVYNIDEYKKAFSLDTNYVEIITESLLELQQIIDNSGKLKSYGVSDLPFVLFSDAQQDFYAKAKIINFRNGNGLLFLTQLSQDVSIINNERLVYIFQGITNDKQFFVYGEFPVSAEGLPDTDTDSFENYKIPEIFYGEKYAENKKANNKYRAKIATKLENLKNDKFSPNLSKIESLLFSLKIN